MSNQSFGVPFPEKAVPGAPTPLGFGFGLGLGFGLGPGTSPGPSPASNAGLSSERTPISSWPRSGSMLPRTTQPSRKRRLSSSSDMDSDPESPSAPAQTAPPASEPQLLPKRMRTGFAPMAMVDDLRSSLPSPSPSNRTPHMTSALSSTANLFPTARAPAAGSSPNPATLGGKSDPNELDVGLLLPSLDKGTLVSIVHGLLIHDNLQVRQAARTAIPPPTLDVALRALQEAHQHVLAVLPDNVSTARPEYTWSRVRTRVADFASTARGLLAYFRLSASMSQQRDKLHPATAFRYLAAACERAMTLSVTLPPIPAAWAAFPSAPGPVPSRTARTNAHTTPPPDPIADSLVPVLIDALRAWSAMLASSMHEGRVFGADAVDEWITRLAELAEMYASSDREAVQSLASTMRSVRAQLVNLYRPSLPAHLLYPATGAVNGSPPGTHYMSGLALPTKEDDEL